MRRSYLGAAVMAAEHDDTEVMQHIEKDVASLVDEIDAENRRPLQNALPQRGEIRAANEGDWNDEADDAAGAYPTKRLFHEEGVEVYVPLGDDGVVSLLQLLRWPEDASVRRVPLPSPQDIKTLLKATERTDDEAAVAAYAASVRRSKDSTRNTPTILSKRRRG